MKNKLLCISLSIVAALAVISSFIFGFFGAKLSFDWKGGNELKIECENSDTVKYAKSEATAQLNKYNISIDSTEVYTNGVKSVVVIKTQQKNISKTAEQKIVEKINALDGATTEGFLRVYPTYKTAAWVIPVVAVVLGLVLSLAVYFTTKRIADLFAFLIGYAASAVLVLSAIVLARLQIGTELVIAAFLTMAIEAVTSFILITKINAEKNSKISKEEGYCEAAQTSVKSSLKSNCALYAVVALAGIVAAAVGKTNTIYFGVMLVVGLCIALVATYLLVPSSKVALENAFEARYSSKMQQKAPEKEPANKKQKQERPKATKVAKPTIKKRKRRNTQNDKVVV